ncbi:hypothetical protein F444_03407 [Phytophthora nicotianae P1976]|uniref:Uncharacterized protein n=1 Tax=Phytophthora nicotianae P1976 TaxID=1317066 RepID=A0A081AU88_PHYNI|nr:hypothetical protein F444_03407 [Phytophthora nicotianae P1976]
MPPQVNTSVIAEVVDTTAPSAVKPVETNTQEKSQKRKKSSSSSSTSKRAKYSSST